MSWYKTSRACAKMDWDESLFNEFGGKHGLISYNTGYDELIAKRAIVGWDGFIKKVKVDYPLFDHVCLFKGSGRSVLVSHPYLTDDEIHTFMKGSNLEYKVLGKDKSFYNKGKTNLLVVYSR